MLKKKQNKLAAYSKRTLVIRLPAIYIVNITYYVKLCEPDMRRLINGFMMCRVTMILRQRDCAVNLAWYIYILNISIVFVDKAMN